MMTCLTIRMNYTTDHMVLGGTGDADHDKLVTLAERHFSSLPISLNPISLSSHHAHPQSSFVGSYGAATITILNVNIILITFFICGTFFWIPTFYIQLFFIELTYFFFM